MLLSDHIFPVLLYLFMLSVSADMEKSKQKSCLEKEVKRKKTNLFLTDSHNQYTTVA